MKITILTLFPAMFKGFLEESILGRAQEKGLLKLEVVNLRNFGEGKRKTVDDTPYGGGAGMVLKVDVVARALSEIKKEIAAENSNLKPKTYLMTPQGKVFTQKKAKELAQKGDDLILVCGHYEGFDERIRDYVDEEISIGDYVLTGGELPAAVITDAVVRLIPGALGKEESHQNESFMTETTSSNLKPKTYLEYPQYTRPEEFEGKKVPEVLKSGDHARIEKWRQEMALERTKKRRPDLLSQKPKSKKSK